ncbi:Na+/H+ antiporter [Klebsiella pneumoniae]|uniref:Na+/H+ antiporter n=1 Tax=Klebsiella pneumoniae TaxID=573 RepID=A0A378AF03_KLEPN|nr:Na+/H+ antiporter [Klebsiella pneumoniae]
MSLIAIVLVFIMAIVVTVFLSHLLPVKVPLPLIQIAAVLTGSFSPGDAVVKFFLMAFGGILSGLVVVWVTGKCNNFLFGAPARSQPSRS